MFYAVAKDLRLSKSDISDAELAVNNLLKDGVRLREVLKELKDTPEPTKHQLLYCSTLLQDFGYAINNGNSDVEDLFCIIDNELGERGVRPHWKYHAEAVDEV